MGDTKTRTADVRLIVATNKDLDAEARAGRFRDDLLYRLNVVEFTLPPLRERSDLIALAEHLLAFFNRQTARKIEGFSAGRAGGDFGIRLAREPAGASQCHRTRRSFRDGTPDRARRSSRTHQRRPAARPGARVEHGPGLAALSPWNNWRPNISGSSSRTAKRETKPLGSWASTRAHSIASGSSSDSERARSPAADEPLDARRSRRVREPGSQFTALQIACHVRVVHAKCKIEAVHRAESNGRTSDRNSSRSKGFRPRSEARHGPCFSHLRKSWRSCSRHCG